MMSSNTELFLKARNFLLENRLDYEKAKKEFKWPVLDDFNWARDWFDFYAKDNQKIALWIKKDDGSDVKLSYQELSTRSDQVAKYFQKLGVSFQDRIIMLLPNVSATWEVMLAAMKIGAILVPTSTLATTKEIEDRITRGKAKFIITDQENASKIPTNLNLTKIVTEVTLEGFQHYDSAFDEAQDYKVVKTKASDALFWYFTSGTTSKAKLVEHTHQSYPVGHLSTMYWIGIKEGDIHQNISSPGWAKHAWSSFFAPFNAGATSFVHDYKRFDANNSMKVLNEVGVNTLCAPPTVWRLMIKEELIDRPKNLKEVVSAGEPLNPEVIESIQKKWNITIRDGYGQSETTAQVGNSPGQKIKPGSMGRPLPGYFISLINSDDKVSSEGEVSIELLQKRPLGLMSGYADDEEKSKLVMKNGYYRTGDEATIDDDGYIFFVGRGDDVFKSSDYRISPFELESVLIEHPLITEAAVIPSPDDIRTNLPKAFIGLKAGTNPSKEIAKEILLFAKEHLPPYKRIRKIEFFDLPKTISGKIRRVELRKIEESRVKENKRGEFEYYLSDFT